MKQQTPIKSTTLYIVCAWCGRYLGKKEGLGQTGISHGICPPCQAKLRKKSVS